MEEDNFAIGKLLDPLPRSSLPASEIVEFTVSAKESFEVFMGKRYDPSQFFWGLGSEARLYSQETVTPSHNSFDSLAAHLTERMRARGIGTRRPLGVEKETSMELPNAVLLSPLDRFARLLSGLQMLQAELCEVGQEERTGEGGRGIFQVLTDGVQVAQDRLIALRPAAEAAHAAGIDSGRGGVGRVARPTPPDPTVFKSLALDAAALVEAQNQAESAMLKARTLATALHDKIKSLSWG